MSKMRVHELAKQLNIDSKSLINVMSELGMPGKVHSNSLEENEIQSVYGHYSKKKPVPEKRDNPIINEPKHEPTVQKPEQKQPDAMPKQTIQASSHPHQSSGGAQGRRPVPQRMAYSSDRPNINRTIPGTGKTMPERPANRPVSDVHQQEFQEKKEHEIPKTVIHQESKLHDQPQSEQIKTEATKVERPEMIKPIVIKQVERPVQPEKSAKPIERMPEFELKPKPTQRPVQKAEDKPVTAAPMIEGGTEPRPAADATPRPQGDRPYTPRPQGQGDRPYTPRPQGTTGDRPYTPRPQGQGDRPYTPRPQGQGDRPYTPRPQGQGDRPYTPRPQGQGDRPYTPRPQGTTGDRPYTPRPQGTTGDRPYTPRPQGQGDRPYTPRPQGTTGDRPYTPRPQGQGDRPYTPRPQGTTGDRPYTPRPQGQGGQGGYSRPPGQGGQGGYSRPPGQGGQGGYSRPPGQGGQGGYSRPPQKPGDSGGKDRPAFDRGGKPGGFKPKDKPASMMTAVKPEKEHSRRLIKDPARKGRIVEVAEKDLFKPSNRRSEPKKPPKPTSIEIGEKITVKDLAEKLIIQGNDLIKSLIKKGMMLTLNAEIDFEKASEIALEYNVLVEAAKEIDPFASVFEVEDDEKDLKERPPVVVVMGHVDHGKTSLLDAIRQAKVASGEAGGITQHIGAYTVGINGKQITFLDTPGHEAFTAMRMRGASITDIAVLVVAADDGVMPQTIEAINHAKAAGVEIIVAINKIDKPSANPDKVKRELTEHGIVTEDWGGSQICVLVSAVNKTGIDQLLEMIIMASEMKELKANPSARARGTVIESSLDKGKGTVATVLVQNGTLNVGDPIVVGGTYGKIRAMMDDKGMRVKKAPPSTPVEILGLPDVPLAGDLFFVADNEKAARAVADKIVAKSRVQMTNASAQKVSLDDLFNQIKAGNIKDLNVIVKADVAGSVEAIRQSLEKLSNEEVRVRIIHGGVGAINESDVMLASTSSAIIIGFNVRPEPSAKSVADENEVDLRLYKVIYNAIEDVQQAMKGMLDPVFAERVVGHAEIRQIFKATAIGSIAGSYITDGKFTRNVKVRIMRNGKVIHEGDLESLKRFKDDVKEVLTGYECGLVFNKFNDIKEGDIVEAFVIEQVERD